MKRTMPLTTAFFLLAGLAMLGAPVLAQPGPSGPGGPGFEPGPPINLPVVPPGPPVDPGSPPRGDDGDDDGDGNGNNGNRGNHGNRGHGDKAIPDFCSRAGLGEGPGGQAGLSSIAHLRFVQIDSDTEEVVEDGAWGRLTYRWTAPLFDFVFNAKQLPPDAQFTLTYQPEPAPSSGVVCLGTGTVNEDGDLHIQDAFDIGTDLPAAYDDNEEEATLALVTEVDVDCVEGEMLEWSPDDYLFGEEGMFYVHSDLDDEEDGEEGEG